MRQPTLSRVRPYFPCELTPVGHIYRRCATVLYRRRNLEGYLYEEI